MAHDGPSHAAMTDHKNWALATAAIFGFLALWSLVKHRGTKTVSIGFVALILLASGLLAVTGFKGGEVVYRHGTGVMRLPEVSGDGGHGSHSHGKDAGTDHHGAKETEHTAQLTTHDTEMKKPAEEGAHDDHSGHSGGHSH